MDQERPLVGHLTKLEPTPKFHRLQQLVDFYSKERNLSTFFAIEINELLESVHLSVFLPMP